MKKWFLIDSINYGDTFIDCLENISKEKATNNLLNEWNHLSKSDKNRRESFYITHCETDNDGCPDENTADDNVFIKDNNVMIYKKIFYAVQENNDDCWDYGSSDFGYAVEMLKNQGYGLITKIEDDGTETYCTKEFYYEDFNF